MSVLLLGWDWVHAQMSVKALGQRSRGLHRKARRWSSCRAELSKKGGLKKKIQPLNQEDAKNLCLHLGSG